MPRPKGSGNRSELVTLALAGIDAQIQQLQAQIDALSEKRKQYAKGGSVVGAAPAAKSVVNAASKKKRVVSAATKKRLKEAAKARWAKVRAEKEGK